MITNEQRIQELEDQLFELTNQSNTINDFYPDTISMIEDLLNLFETKVLDNIGEGDSICKTRLREIMGFAYRYVRDFTKG